MQLLKYSLLDIFIERNHQLRQMFYLIFVLFFKTSEKEVILLFLKPNVVIENGFLKVSSRPSFGVELNEDRLD